MTTYTNEATADQSKTDTGKTGVLEALEVFEMALCECIHTATIKIEGEGEEPAPLERHGERLESLRRCMEEMRTGVLALHGVVKREWPE